ncbi:MAG TPA: MGMT family protein [Thermodesulfobacteriaceae bacterium]|nr:MGMT family protein [Thermodesulfobacteriaceae bacterium]
MVRSIARIEYLEIMGRVLELRSEWEQDCLIGLELSVANLSATGSNNAFATALRGLLTGEGAKLSFACSAGGSRFQKKVWEVAARIGAGETRTYGEVASEIGCRSPRAVGQALKVNPLPIIIPCHRVVGRYGRLTGFSCGLEIKRLLLEFEGTYRTS